jgi:hypothetical protein
MSARRLGALVGATALLALLAGHLNAFKSQATDPCNTFIYNST